MRATSWVMMMTVVRKESKIAFISCKYPSQEEGGIETIRIIRIISIDNRK